MDSIEREPWPPGITAFRPRVDDEQIERLRTRLRSTRWPDQVPGTGWDLGTDREYLQDLTRYWADSFDWRTVEERLNFWPNALYERSAQPIHFVQACADSRASRSAILLLHGWPGSILEFLNVIPLLVTPEHGDGIDVVCPSMPGFGWSGPTNELGWSPRRIAGEYLKLMDDLGYQQFYAQGGDYGAAVALQLAAQAPQRVRGVHLNFIRSDGPQQSDGELTRHEQEIVSETEAYRATEEGYIALQRTKPQTLAYALNDSPAGLAAWLVEKYRRWTDCDGVIENAIARDDLLGLISLYWFTGTVGSAARIYHASAPPGESRPLGYVGVPVGCALFPKEIYRSSRRWAERHMNIVRWTDMGRGGHFPALEQPLALAADIRQFIAMERVQ